MLLQRTFKIVIVLFCIWHMWAVWLYAMPKFDREGVDKWLEEHHLQESVIDSLSGIFEWMYADARGFAKPYVLSTSQWQRWNLFSPDPLRRVIWYHIDIGVGSEWEEWKVVGPEAIEWWMRAGELKMIRRLEEDGKDLLRERYVQLICTEGLEPGTKLRLRKRYYIIPSHTEMQDRDWWEHWAPEWKETVDLITHCPEVL